MVESCLWKQPNPLAIICTMTSVGVADKATSLLCSLDNLRGSSRHSIFLFAPTVRLRNEALILKYLYPPSQTSTEKDHFSILPPTISCAEMSYAEIS